MSTIIYLKKKEVSVLIGRSPDWVRLHSRFNNPAQPVLKAVRVLGHYRWTQADVDQFIAANTEEKS